MKPVILKWSEQATDGPEKFEQVEAEPGQFEQARGGPDQIEHGVGCGLSTRIPVCDMVVTTTYLTHSVLCRGHEQKM